MAYGLLMATVGALLGAGVALQSYAETFPEGGARWSELAAVGRDCTVASAVSGITYAVVVMVVLRVRPEWGIVTRGRAAETTDSVSASKEQDPR